MKSFNSENIKNFRLKKRKPETDESANSDTSDIELILSLASLGCSVVDLQKDATLISEADNRITNPNIKSKIPSKNKKKSTDKSFPNEDDPFYKVDAQLTDTKFIQDSNTKISQNAQKIQILVADLDSLSTTIG